MVDYHYDGDNILLDKVQLTDFDNVVHLPNGKHVKGLIGNENWRSPEAFFKARASKPTDVYSFGLVCLYAILGRVILGRDADMAYHEAKGALPDMIRLQRLVSYFGTGEDVRSLTKHLGDDAVGIMCLQLLWKDRNEPYIPYKPFVDWPEVKDEMFKDLMLQMMNLNPARRITAETALNHDWFKGA